MASQSQNGPIIPVLAAIIQNEQNRVLIARRKPGLSNGRKWEFPGGKLLVNESPEECLKREIREEMGVNVKVTKPFHLVNFREGQRSILLIGYLCEFLGGDWALADHDQILWVEKERLCDYEFSAADIPIVNKLQKALFVL